MLFTPVAPAAANPGATAATTIRLPLLRLAEAWPQTPEQRAIAEAVLEIVNAERAAAGCPPVTLNAELTAAAQAHSEDMAVNNFFSHTGSNGSDPNQRARLAGYTGRSGWENVAAGYSSPAAVMQGWINSEGHRQNILNCSLREMGLGYVFEANDSYPGPYGYRHYWTQTFGIP
jgi:uncharacterized protein YkwD